MVAQKIDLSKIVQQAKEKGYFDPADFSGQKLSGEQLKELSHFLEKEKIPVETQNIRVDLSKNEALQVINSLRKGVPPQVNLTKFSVGRKKLIGRFKEDLEAAGHGSPQVRFLSADYGCGKTHSLYLMREHAFNEKFVVSIVTLSRNSCPIHDFMAVYYQIMWNLRTPEERMKPALENVLDKWFPKISEIGPSRARKIIEEFPDDLKNALTAYYQINNPLNNKKEEQKLLIFNYLSGKKVPLRDLRRIGIRNRIDSSNALPMLGYMATLFRNLGYRGICIFFDEAESIHSFAKFEHQTRAYDNLLQIVKRSQSSSHCYFLYATTPSFFDNYFFFWRDDPIRQDQIYELEKLDSEELEKLASNLCQIYSLAVESKFPPSIEQTLKKLASDPSFSNNIGEFVRKCISYLDEKSDAKRRLD